MKQEVKIIRVSMLSLFFWFTSGLCEMTMAQAKPKQVKSNITFKQLDTLTIERTIGIKGKANNGEYKVTIPQNDLDVEVDSFKIIPAMGLSTWVAFTPAINGAMIMGDIVVAENDLKPVQEEIIKQGLTSTAFAFSAIDSVFPEPPTCMNIMFG